jgi:peptide chain release factor 3
LDVFLHYFHRLAPPPQGYEYSKGEKRGLEDEFSGFIFKMQANMNPGHRDCAAFIRIASGKFVRGQDVVVAHTGKKLKLATPHTLMGDDRQLLEEAYPGDIVSIFNPGDFRIGTTVYAKNPVQFDIIPLFTPEHFQKVATKDPFKRKQLREGLQQLSEEGVVHVFEVPNGVGNELLLGTVGVLQFEVVEHRMREEYNVDLVKTPVAYHCARWLPNDRADIISKLESAYSTHVTKDMEENPIVLFDSMYALQQAEEKIGAQHLFKFKQG